MEPIIEFENFTFKYRSQMEPTLRDINLKIYPGEKVLIIGPSGSGKSTLSNCINGLIPFSYEGDSTGTLKIEGKDPKNLGFWAFQDGWNRVAGYGRAVYRSDGCGRYCFRAGK